MKLNAYTHIISAISPLSGGYEFNLLHPSPFAKAHLYHLNIATQMTTGFPFYIECKPFNSYFILYTTEGEGKLTYDEQTYHLCPYTIVFIDCNKPFRLDLYKSSHWNFTFFLFNGSSTSAYFEKYYESNHCLCDLSLASNIPLVINKLLQCSTYISPDSDYIISKLITDLLTELILAKENSLSTTDNLPKYLIQIKALFDANYKEHFNLDELASTYNVSKYKIIRDFTTHLNNSPINYLIEKRITVAKKLLLETDYPIYEIASLVGMDNINHFTNLFKKITHLTPNKYRKIGQIESTKFLDE